MLEFQTADINQNFKIKVHGIIEGKKVNSLYGVSGILNLLENTKTYEQCQIELFNSILKKAFVCQTDKYQYKLRRGIKITLYRH
jgi:hypothetical protein